MRRKDAELVQGIRADLALARGVARARYEIAEEILSAAKNRLSESQRGETELVSLIDSVLALVDEASAGSASAPWSALSVVEPRRPVGALDLYRVGTLRFGQVSLPALLPLLDASHVIVHTAEERREEAAGLISGLLLRALVTTQPGSVQLSVYDPERLGSTLAGFAPLSDAGLLASHGPDSFNRLLNELVDHIRRINERVLVGQYASLRDLAQAIGHHPETWRVAVLFGGKQGLTKDQQANVERIMRTGVPCGVHLILCDIDVPIIGQTVSITLESHVVRSTLASRRWELDLDAGPPQELITSTCQRLADNALVGPDPSRFSDLLPERLWTASSAAYLEAPVGDHEGELVNVMLGDSPPHALVSGPSGSGKTNFLYALLGSLAARYHPHELEFYLLDFKEGVSFARFGRGRKDPSWLPHARLIGININEDREFGLALLRYLSEQLRIRAEAAKAHEVTKLEELRKEDPNGRWPRLVAVIDEFQYLFHVRDAVSEEAVRLLEDLARRGRSQGIHLILSSQDLSSIEALWGKSSITAQFTLRVAMPKARRILAENNGLADSIPRYHAVVNPESGSVMANQVARLPDAAARDGLDALQAQLWQRRPPELSEPILFDGDVVPSLESSPDFRSMDVGSRRVPTALVGQLVDVRCSAAGVRMSRAPGRNLAVIGTRTEETCDVLAAATLSLSRQYEPGDVTFTIACLDDDAMERAEMLFRQLREAGHETTWHDLDDIRKLLFDTAGHVEALITGENGQPMRARYLVLYAVDVANALLDAKHPQTRVSGLENLRRIIKRGPEVHMHVLAWWRTVQRLKEDLGGVGTRLDDIGSWIALDVQGSELSPLPGGQMQTWHPRVRRALFFDRTVHSRPQLVIPFDTGSMLLPEVVP